MDKNESFDDFCNRSFEILSDSVKRRIKPFESHTCEITSEISKLEDFINKKFKNGKIGKNKFKTETNVFYEQYNEVINEELSDSISDEMSFCSESCQEDKAIGPHSSEYRSSSYSVFIKALGNLVNLYEILDKTGEISKFTKAPPVPVTELFRKHNPEASNIFDFNNTEDDSDENTPGLIFNFNVMSKIMTDSIRTCLVSPSEFDKVSKALNSPDETLFNSFNHSDLDANECYKILKVLFSWYFSGYYTGRMEVITQSFDK
uniref:Uncharacterized protein n=1 Tax=Theileria annulata TaxID=5874 RepID=A0A3B0NC85_THEAN